MAITSEDNQAPQENRGFISRRGLLRAAGAGAVAVGAAALRQAFAAPAVLRSPLNSSYPVDETGNIIIQLDNEDLINWHRGMGETLANFASQKQTLAHSTKPQLKISRTTFSPQHYAEVTGIPVLNQSRRNNIYMPEILVNTEGGEGTNSGVNYVQPHISTIINVANAYDPTNRAVLVRTDSQRIIQEFGSGCFIDPHTLYSVNHVTSKLNDGNSHLFIAMALPSGRTALSNRITGNWLFRPGHGQLGWKDAEDKDIDGITVLNGVSREELGEVYTLLANNSAATTIPYSEGHYKYFFPVEGYVNPALFSIVLKTTLDLGETGPTLVAGNLDPMATGRKRSEQRALGSTTTNTTLMSVMDILSYGNGRLAGASGGNVVIAGQRADGDVDVTRFGASVVAGSNEVPGYEAYDVPRQ